MNTARLLTRTLKGTSWWIITASSLQIAVDATTYAVTRTTTHTTPGAILTNPLRLIGGLPNPYAGLSDNSTVVALLYLETLLLLGGLIWVSLLRHGYGNPLSMLRPEHELPLARQLTPKLRDLGIWAPHDAARGNKQAPLLEKLKVKLLKTFRPTTDLARALTHRSNGILVPYQEQQPDARIFLGHYRHLHLFRRRKYNVYARPEQHVVIFGPSGAGKGATQMNPTLLFWNGTPSDSPDGHGSGWPGAIITSTVKSDHVDVALEWRLSLSDQCYIYDPLQMYPEYKQFWVGWNPLSTVYTFSDAAAVAAALMESESQQGAGGGGGNEDYFKAQALMVLAPMILAAARAKQPFRTVYDWSLRIESEVTDPNVVSDNGDVAPDSRMYATLEPLISYAEETGDETPLNQMQQVFTKDPREASGVWGSVRKVLQPYNDEKSVHSTDPAHMPRMLNPRDFYSTPHSTLFIVAPEVANEARRMRPVFAAFITWLIEEAQKLAREKNGKLPYPVLANLDEVKNVGAIPGLAHTLSLTRSIGFFVKHAWQDEAQIASAYGKDDAKTITSNSRTWVILPGISDPDHLEALSRLIGERPVKRRKAKASEERDDKDRMRSASASMVKEIKDDELLILTDNLPPFVIKATRYFQDNVMLARYQLGDHRRATGTMPDPQQLRRQITSTSTHEDLGYTTPGHAPVLTTANAPTYPAPTPAPPIPPPSGPPTPIDAYPPAATTGPASAPPLPAPPLPAPPPLTAPPQPPAFLAAHEAPGLADPASSAAPAAADLHSYSTPEPGIPGSSSLLESMLERLRQPLPQDSASAPTPAPAPAREPQLAEPTPPVFLPAEPPRTDPATTAPVDSLPEAQDIWAGAPHAITPGALTAPTAAPFPSAPTPWQETPGSNSPAHSTPAAPAAPAMPPDTPAGSSLATPARASIAELFSTPDDGAPTGHSGQNHTENATHNPLEGKPTSEQQAPSQPQRTPAAAPSLADLFSTATAPTPSTSHAADARPPEDPQHAPDSAGSTPTVEKEPPAGARTPPLPSGWQTIDPA